MKNGYTKIPAKMPKMGKKQKKFPSSPSGKQGRDIESEFRAIMKGK